MLRIPGSRGGREPRVAGVLSSIRPGRTHAGDIRFGALSESLTDPLGRGPFAPGGSTS
jgi:hypothetical protein